MAHIHLSPDPQAVAAAATEWLDSLLSASTGPFHMALSGGSTPKLMFAHWAQQAWPWERLHLWWVDERCVPPDHADSNYGMTREQLLDQVPLPAAQVHRMRGEDAPATEARRYGDLIYQHLPQEDGLPVFDLIWLGMGDDGHTASIFPHQLALIGVAEPCAVATHPTSGQQRITLTGPVLNAARQVAFLVTGRGKRPRLTEIFHQTPGYSQYPAAHIQPITGELHWFWDEAAQPEDM